MNGNYYQNPTFPGAQIKPPNIPSNQGMPGNQNMPGSQSIPDFDQAGPMPISPQVAPGEQSYIENIIRLNKGKLAKFYVTIPDSKEWTDKVFSGVIEHAGRDNIIVSNPSNGEWYLILMIYLDYVVFDEPIVYRYPR